MRCPAPLGFLLLVLVTSCSGGPESAPPAVQSAEEQQKRWHGICMELTRRKGGGFLFRQCMKDQRSADRKKHADGLRTSLAHEFAALHARQGGSGGGSGGGNNGGKGGSTSQANPPPGPPHILLITTDQQRRDSLGCYGPVVGRERRGFRPFACTPHLDRLASEGCLVRDAWAAAPVCTPSRTSLLTGVHVPVHGVAENGLGSFDAAVLTPFVDVLAARGYATGLIGKAGFSPLPPSLHHVNLVGEGGESRDKGTHLDDFLETYLVNCSLQWVLERDRLAPTQPWFLHLSLASPHPPNTLPEGWDPPYARAADEPGAGSGASGGAWPEVDFFAGDLEALPLQTKLLQAMRDSPEDDPAVARTLAGALANTNAHAVFRGPGSGVSPTAAWHRSSRAFPSELGGLPSSRAVAEARWAYFNQAAFVDAQVGRLLDVLDKDLRLGARLLTIFTSDHGANLHDHGRLAGRTFHFCSKPWPRNGPPIVSRSPFQPFLACFPPPSPFVPPPHAPQESRTSTRWWATLRACHCCYAGLAWCPPARSSASRPSSTCLPPSSPRASRGRATAARPGQWSPPPRGTSCRRSPRAQLPASTSWPSSVPMVAPASAASTTRPGPRWR